MAKNYWKTNKLSLFLVSYVYIDCESYLSIPIFEQENIRLKVNDEMARENSPYRIIFCKVLKKDALRFEDAIGKLWNKMLLMGYKDYEEICSEVETLINN